MKVFSYFSVCDGLHVILVISDEMQEVFALMMRSAVSSLAAYVDR